jgi:integrase
MLLLCKTYCPVPEVRAAIRIAFYSGMRRGEILAAVQGQDAFVLEDTKNGERRIVPVHPKVRCCIGYEWPSKYKLGYWFRKARSAIARPDLHFHDLRHSTASAMVSAGIDLYTVGGVLGHKSQASTGRYAHLYTDALRRAIGQIGRPDSSPLRSGNRIRSSDSSPMEARAGVEPTYSDLQSRKRA